MTKKIKNIIVKAIHSWLGSEPCRDLKHYELFEHFSALKVQSFFFGCENKKPNCTKTEWS